MIAKTFKVGDLVWAKMKAYPPWPGKVIEPPNQKGKKGQQYIYFFGTKNHSWIKDENIMPHSEDQLKNTCKRKFQGYFEAIDEIKKESLTKVKSPDKLTTDEDKKDHATDKTAKINKVKTKLTKENALKSDTSNKVSKKRKSSTEENLLKSDHVSPNKKKRRLSTEKNLLKTDSNLPNKASQNRKLSTEDVNTLDTKTKKTPDDFSDLIKNVLECIAVDEEQKKEEEEEKNKREQGTATLPNEIPPAGSSALDPKKPKLLGFLGLGNIGKRLALNLLRAGFKVMVWNKTESKCDDLVKEGAKKGATVAEVVRCCEITFCCVSDADAVKTIVMSNGGILDGFIGLEAGSRKIVEMSSVDMVTLKNVSHEIIRAGMHYCEASVLGNKQGADEGKMLILGGGDKEVFDECKPYFLAMAGCAYYLSDDFGHCAGVTALTNTFMGVMYAAMAEILALAKRAGLAAGDLLEIFELRGILSPLLQEKGKAIMEKSYVKDTPINLQEKDMNIALQLSDQVGQPTPIASIATSIYTRAKMMGMSKYDSTGTYLCYSH